MIKKRFVFLLLTAILCVSVLEAQGRGVREMNSNPSMEAGMGGRVIYETGAMPARNDSGKIAFKPFMVWSFAVFFLGMLFMWVVLFGILGFRKPVVQPSRKAGEDYAPVAENVKKRNGESQNIPEYMHKVDELCVGQRDLGRQYKQLNDQIVCLKEKLSQSSLIGIRQSKMELPETSAKISTGAVPSQPLNRDLPPEQENPIDARTPINQDSYNPSASPYRSSGYSYIDRSPYVPSAPKTRTEILDAFNTWASGNLYYSNHLPSIFSYANHSGSIQTPQTGNIETSNPEAEWIISREPDTDGKRYLFPNPSVLNQRSRLEELYTKSGAYKPRGENRIEVNSPCITNDEGYIIDKGSFTII
jgi:hypothetical protein